jgi:hypothetical protein
MTDNNSVPGMVYPTQKGMLAGNPRDSAMQSMNSSNQNAALASKLLSGGKLRKFKKKFRGGDSIPVPQFHMQYESQGGPGTNPNNQIQLSSQTSTQMAANSAMDNGATKMGGAKRRKGGNPNWLWGCMSGGTKKRRKLIKKRKTKSRRSNTKRRTTKSRRH